MVRIYTPTEPPLLETSEKKLAYFPQPTLKSCTTYCVNSLLTYFIIIKVDGEKSKQLYYKKICF